jgi:hypothetical protein
MRTEAALRRHRSRIDPDLIHTEILETAGVGAPIKRLVVSQLSVYQHHNQQERFPTSRARTQWRCNYLRTRFPASSPVIGCDTRAVLKND